MSLNIIFAGTPEFALPCLDALINSPYNLQAVFTQPDRPAGRGRKVQFSAVKTRALEFNVPVHQPANFKDVEAIAELANYKPDLLIVIAYGLILPRTVLNIPRFGCINVHASLLPRWRGASPIQHAILYGDKETGVTIMQMDVGMDTGDILRAVTYTLDNQETAATLHDKLAQLAVASLLATIEECIAGTLTPVAQNAALATCAPKINKTDALINWAQPADFIVRQIRAFNPWPIAYMQADNMVYRIYQARQLPERSLAQPGTILSIAAEGVRVVTGAQEVILLEKIQQPGGKVMLVAEWLRAGTRALTTGMVLLDVPYNES